MIGKIADKEKNGYEWLDITTPSEEEFKDIAEKYKLHPALVNDCLQPDHLPKFERMKDHSFVIFRIYTDINEAEADSVQELTN